MRVDVFRQAYEWFGLGKVSLVSDWSFREMALEVYKLWQYQGEQECKEFLAELRSVRETAVRILGLDFYIAEVGGSYWVFTLTGVQERQASIEESDLWFRLVGVLGNGTG